MSYNPFFYRWDFVKRRKLFFILSLTLIALGLISLIFRGLNLSVDFTSGSRVEVLIGKPFTEAEIRNLLAPKNMIPSSFQMTGQGENLTAVLTYKGTITKEQFAELKTLFTEKYGKQVSLNESTVSPQVGRELAQKALLSVLIASIGIILYVTIRYEYRFAISSVLALLHDTLIVIGIFSLIQVEVDLTFIVALLTIIGYSINDTIVTFDRIRENMRKMKIKKVEDVENLVNRSIQETLVRSVNTVMTVLFGAVALLIFGGPGVFTFSLALTFGLFFGAYSSIFIASQLWVQWKEWDLKRAKLKPEA
nr:protein translocase subunit SecF [Thermicanus aegyptius]